MNYCLTCLVREGFGLLDQTGSWLAHLGLRLLLAYEFFESGLEKWRGENWFTDIQDSFPFPLDRLSADLSWQLATWTELIAPLALILGLGTRFASAALVVLTAVAWSSVHAGNGYNVCDNGFKLPLIYIMMLVPLLLAGPGRLSLDHLIASRHRPD